MHFAKQNAHHPKKKKRETMAFSEKFHLSDGSEILIEQLTGREDVRDLLNHINALVKEKTWLLVDKPLTLPYEKKWFKEQVKKNRGGKCIYLKALANGKLAATATAERGKDNDNGNVEVGIAILAEWRGMGLGRKLLSTAIMLAKKRWKPRNIYLTAFEKNTGAIGLYKSLGFRQIAVLPNWTRHYGKYESRILMLLKK
jgi:RimJ/RimL family protein N-acetyltransferase